MGNCSCFPFGGGGRRNAKHGKSERWPQSERLLPKKEVKEGHIGHAQFIIDNPGNITDFYNLSRSNLGTGSYGSVCKAVNKSTNQVRAVKTIQKGTMRNIERFKQEIAIMKMMDHPHIIKLYESFDDMRNIYLVMELCGGGELFDKIIESGQFAENHCAILVEQMVKAVNYMHENRICHRDLKPENFLFSNKERIETNSIKIIDFGLSCQFTPGVPMKTKAGTPYYVAPQVIAGKYDHLCDMWSAGVIMYVMLCGYPPFFGDTDAEILAKVRTGKYTFSSKDWKGISEDAKDLIRCLLKLDPAERYSAKKALGHAWIKNTAPKLTGVNLQANFVDNLRTFRSNNKLKRAALHIIAGQLNEKEIQALRDTFMALDDNGDGLLTLVELKEGLAKAGLKEIPPDLQQLMEEIDSDGSGVIDYTEFLAATLEQRSYVQEDVCWSAFRLFDRNGDGKISPDELKAVLNDNDVQNVAGMQAVAQLLKEVDSNGDGFIDFDEFMTMMRKKA